jgi:hypothetical protein
MTTLRRVASLTNHTARSCYLNYVMADTVYQRPRVLRGPGDTDHPASLELPGGIQLVSRLLMCHEKVRENAGTSTALTV